MSKWKNAGAPFTLSDGTDVGTGDVFEAAWNNRDVVMRRRKLEPMAPDTEVTVDRPDGEEEDEDDGEDE